MSRPWAKSPPQKVSGTGVVIEGQRILTNTHVVKYASQVQVQANQSGEALVFPREQAVAATEEILTDNGVRAQGSADMMKIWQGK
jgi:S1-C subfamily serine protease